VRVPILCYHRIETPPVGAADDTNFVSPAHFDGHLASLHTAGFTGVTVRDLLAWQRGEGVLPAKPIAITFDDAYASVVTHAVPALDKYRWPCSVFAVSGYVGGRNVWDPHAPPATLLDAEALRSLLTAGHDVGAHTRYHRRVRGLDEPDAMEELSGAKHDLELLLGVACDSLAFPYGSHDPDTLARVQRAGYRGALTLKRWTNGVRTNPYRLGRMSVGGPLPPWRLRVKLAKMFFTPSFS
jgi:peptidoglycan/xylan/chitin deacetylase (PgdA/CDA1 family)